MGLPELWRGKLGMVMREERRAWHSPKADPTAADAHPRPVRRKAYGR